MYYICIIYKMKVLLTSSSILYFLHNKGLYKSKDSLDCEDDVLKFAKKAICILNPDGDSQAKGIVEIGQIQINKPVHIKGKFSGLGLNSKHGFHIHQWGNLSQGCVTAGPHFNPNQKNHGGPYDNDRHIGDLGNVESDSNGHAVFELVDHEISLFGRNSVVGRSMVLHKNEDDLGKGGFEDSLTTGHSGSRIACGVIGLAEFSKEDLFNYLY